MNVKASLAEYINARTTQVLAMQNPDGSFGPFRMSNGDYPFYSMAYLLKKMPGHSWYGSPQLKDALLRILEFFFHTIDAEGKAEFFGMNGFSWGKLLVSDWPMFCWQETLQLVKDDLPPEMYARHKARCLELLKGHYEGIGKRLIREPDPFATRVHNLFVWQLLMMYRAGVLWENDSWKTLGADILRRAVRAQHAEGWWSEGGPIVGYNNVTAVAISLFAEWSGDEEALRAVEKAAHYHQTFAYPDGTGVETIDGRQRYHAGVTFFPPSYSRFPEGRAYMRRVMPALAKEKPYNVYDLQVYNFVAFVYEHLQDDPPPEQEKPLPPVTVLPGIHSATVRQDGWYGVLCGYETLTHLGGFRLERQNLLSVWHKKTGLILGGGHSNYQPEFSNFNVIDRKGILYYLHAHPAIRAADAEAGLSLTYGDLPVTISVRFADDRHAIIRYSAESYTDEAFARFQVRTNLILVAHPGKAIKCKKHDEVLGEKSLLWVEEDFQDGGIEHHGWRLRIPKRHESVSVKWPNYPYFSYRADRKSSLDSSAIIASATMFPKEPFIEYEIEIL